MWKRAEKMRNWTEIMWKLEKKVETVRKDVETGRNNVERGRNNVEQQKI